MHTIGHETHTSIRPACPRCVRGDQPQGIRARHAVSRPRAGAQGDTRAGHDVRRVAHGRARVQGPGRPGTSAEADHQRRGTACRQSSPVFGDVRRARHPPRRPGLLSAGRRSLRLGGECHQDRRRLPVGAEALARDGRAGDQHFDRDRPDRAAGTALERNAAAHRAGGFVEPEVLLADADYRAHAACRSPVHHQPHRIYRRAGLRNHGRARSGAVGLGRAR